MPASGLVADVLIILAAGLLSGFACKRLGISLLVGYLVVGGLIGGGGLGLVSGEDHDLEYLAHAGALFLLFAVGLEFSPEELKRLSRFFLIGGSVQMLLVAVPLTLVCTMFGLPWRAAVLAGSAGALSSTVLVFKALTEWGQMATPHGRRAIGILLFQDVALVPLMLFVPLLTGDDASPTTISFLLLAAKSILFVMAIVLLRRMIASWIVPVLASLRSVELVVVFTLLVLGGVCYGSFLIGLPSAMGALAAGLMLSGNRLSQQVDTLILPFRESFAVVFFVSLGSLLEPMSFFGEPVLLASGIVGILLLKTFAAGIALRLVGLSWHAALGMGMGLAQLGEFSFLLIAEGVSHGIITSQDYGRMLFVALGTLILTPQLLKIGLRWSRGEHAEYPDTEEALGTAMSGPILRALVVGIGPIGRQISCRLETMGVDVCLIDLSPINLYSFAQQGFSTVAGDARERDVLMRANVRASLLAVVCVPDDEAATQVVPAIREVNPEIPVIVRCRYVANVSKLKSAGARLVVSEEDEASGALLRICERIVRTAAAEAEGNAPNAETDKRT